MIDPKIPSFLIHLDKNDSSIKKLYLSLTLTPPYGVPFNVPYHINLKGANYELCPFDCSGHGIC